MPIAKWKVEIVDGTPTLVRAGREKVKTSISLPSDYQKWTGYPDSPLLTSQYPYQVIINNTEGGAVYLILDDTPLYRISGDGWQTVKSQTTFVHYLLSYGVWEPDGNYEALDYVQMFEANNSFYSDSTITDVYFAKTTSPAQDGDGTSVSSLSMPIAKWKVKRNQTAYQQWNAYPKSLVNKDDYQYQCVVIAGDTYLCASPVPFSTEYAGSSSIRAWNGTAWDSFQRYFLSDGEWVHTATATTQAFVTSVPETNSNIYTDRELGTVLYEKTTTPQQDAGIQESLVRIR